LGLAEAIHKAGLGGFAAQKRRLRKAVSGVSDADSVSAGAVWDAVSIAAPIGVSIARTIGLS